MGLLWPGPQLGRVNSGKALFGGVASGGAGQALKLCHGAEVLQRISPAWVMRQNTSRAYYGWRARLKLRAVRAHALGQAEHRR